MGNQIIGKTTGKEDIECLVNMTGNTNSLPGLAIGDWIVNGVGANRPMKVHVKFN
jgi:hypothetical protein